ncbi:MAG: molybdopterin-dependent oxidoreductase [Xanthomonadales bacterium]|nr:molybdopterin-dependent oxidoreductase [Xanthomonadales bacterium]
MFQRSRLSALATAIATPTLSRRQFVLGASLVGTALMVGCRMDADDDAAPAAHATVKPAAGSPFEAYIAIAADGFVTVYSSQFDMGQNSYHGLATLVAEELDVALDKVQVEGRAGNPTWYGNLVMGGAFQLHRRLQQHAFVVGALRTRRASCAARELLKQAAATQWKVEIGELTTANGEVVHADGRRATYASLIAAAAPLRCSAKWR